MYRNLDWENREWEKLVTICQVEVWGDGGVFKRTVPGCCRYILTAESSTQVSVRADRLAKRPKRGGDAPLGIFFPTPLPSLAVLSQALRGDLPVIVSLTGEWCTGNCLTQNRRKLL